MLAAQTIQANPVVGVVLGIVLFALGRVLVRKVAIAEQNPWLVKVMTWSLALHLLAAPAQIFTVQHIYHGIADWTRYTHQGAGVANNFRHFNFSTQGTDISRIVNDGSVSIAAGIVMSFVGPDDLSTFLVFGWLAFIGGVFYYRAFTLTFAGAGFRRYGLLVFLLPSTIFWTGDTSKESLMYFAFGFVAYGAARVFRSRPGGFLIMIPGIFVAFEVRPNELLLLAGGFAVAMTLRVVNAGGEARAIRRVLGFAVGAALLVFSYTLTQHYLVHNGNSLTGQLQATNAANSLSAGGVQSGGVPYSSNPATFPRDIYEVLFNPLPINAHGSSQLIAAFENAVIIGVILTSFRHLRMLFRASFCRPYVLMCVTYSIGFMYAFAALGNLGLIERERTIMLPFFLVPFCIPRGPKRAPPFYEWELRQRDRVRLREVFARTGGRLPWPAALAAAPLARQGRRRRGS